MDDCINKLKFIPSVTFHVVTVRMIYIQRNMVIITI